MKNPIFSFAAAVLAISVLASGCTAMREMDASKTEQTLGAAGFRALPANTPQRQASLKNLEAYELQPVAKQGTVYYIFPAPNQNVLYVGDQKAYQKYQQIGVQQNTLQEEEMTAAMNQEAAAEWEDWDAWGPMWY